MPSISESSPIGRALTDRQGPGNAQCWNFQVRDISDKTEENDGWFGIRGIRIADLCVVSRWNRIDAFC